MFRPEIDRVEYGSELLPPEGFHLVRAVATTYSMDFETLITALIPLVLRGDIDDDELHTNPIAILQAIRNVVGKLVIFCEAGQIKAPTTNNKLAAILDDVVVQVALPKIKGQYPSFHPKTWLIEYKNNNGDHLWKFIVLSRNLTKDHSWDVAVSLIGEKCIGNYGATKSLLPFYEFLRGRVNKGAGTDIQKNIVKDLITSLKGVSFFCDFPFEKFDIFPMGIKHEGSHIESFTIPDIFDELVIISPFLSPQLIKKYNGSNNETKKRKRILFSRAKALGMLKPTDVDMFKRYVLRTIATEAAELHDLHAKLYLWKMGSHVKLCLGSANATISGMTKNIEMMICLHCFNRHLNADKLLEEICNGDPNSKSSPLEEVIDIFTSNTETEDKAKHEAEEKIKEICRIKITGEVIEKDSLYQLSLSSPIRLNYPGVIIRPINTSGNKFELNGEMEIKFPTPIGLEDLSSLFVLSVKYEGGNIERVIKIPIKGIPETRKNAIFNKIIKDISSLNKYLMMLLSSNPGLTINRLNRENEFISSGTNKNSTSRIMFNLYEEMLQAAAENPERIREIGKVFENITSNDETIIQYKKLYSIFAEALKL